MSSTVLIFCVTVSPDGIVLVSQGETHSDSGEYEEDTSMKRVKRVKCAQIEDLLSRLGRIR